MEEKVICSSNKLVAIADSIREQVDKEDKFTLDEMSEEIKNILNIKSLMGDNDILLYSELDNLGGSTSVRFSLHTYNDKKLYVYLPNIKEIKQYMLAVNTNTSTSAGENDGIYKLYIPNCEKIVSQGLNGNSALTEIIGDKITSIETYGLNDSYSLTKLNTLNITNLGQRSLRNTGLKKLILPKIGIMDQYCLNQSKVEIIDIGSEATISSITTNAFYASRKLKTVIIRKNSLVTIGSVNTFYSTAFSSDETYGTGGSLYVPQSLIGAYQSSSNWSTVLGYNANNQILPIEGSIYENPDWWKEETE